MTVERLRTAQEASFRAATLLPDRERVLHKLRDLLEHPEGTRAEHTALRAAELLGKRIGLFREFRVPEKCQPQIPKLVSDGINQNGSPVLLLSFR